MKYLIISFILMSCAAPICEAPIQSFENCMKAAPEAIGLNEYSNKCFNLAVMENCKSWTRGLRKAGGQ